MAADEVVVLAGLRVTAPLRTVVDLGRQLPLVEAVAAVDMALNRKVVTLDALTRCAAQPGLHRRRRLLKVLALADADAGAESPMETRLRLILDVPGLPKPLTQQVLRDSDGFAIGRADLYYPQARLAVEYDGTAHRDNLAADNRRQNRILGAGYGLLRFTAADVLGAPAAVQSQVRSVLQSRAS